MNWYEIKAKTDSADIYIYDEIGAFGVSARDFVQDLVSLKGRTLNIYINSPGGSARDSIAIYQALKRHNAPVHTMVDSIAASAASIVTQAGSTRTMAKPASMMIHNPFAIAAGDSGTMAKAKEALDIIGDQLAGIYADRSGAGTIEEWRDRMREETWYTAEGAKEAGLADNVADAVPIAAKYSGKVFNLSNYVNVPEWVPQEVTTVTTTTSDGTNTDVTWKTTTQPSGSAPASEEREAEDMATLAEVLAALGLDEDGDPIAAIDTLKAAATDIATGEKGEANALKRELEEERKARLTETTELRQQLIEVNSRFRQKEAEWVVDSAIQAGRVLPKDRDMSIKLAINDPDSFRQFASTLRVDLNERGAAIDAAMAEIEPTEDEIRIAASMGVTREQLIAEKAKEKGITVPTGS